MPHYCHTPAFPRLRRIAAGQLALTTPPTRLGGCKDRRRRRDAATGIGAGAEWSCAGHNLLPNSTLGLMGGAPHCRASSSGPPWDCPFPRPPTLPGTVASSPPVLRFSHLPPPLAGRVVPEIVHAPFPDPGHARSVVACRVQHTRPGAILIAKRAVGLAGEQLAGASEAARAGGADGCGLRRAVRPLEGWAGGWAEPVGQACQAAGKAQASRGGQCRVAAARLHNSRYCTRSDDGGGEQGRPRRQQEEAG